MVIDGMRFAAGPGNGPPEEKSSRWRRVTPEGSSRASSMEEANEKGYRRVDKRGPQSGGVGP